MIIGLGTYPGLWFPPKWIFTFPVLGSPRIPHWAAFGGYYGSLVVLGGAWMWLLRVVRLDARVPTWAVLGVFLVWSAPFLAGPVVSSEDAFAYVALGRLVERGFDPYESGVDVLGPDAAVAVTPPFWRENPTPYGPVFVRVAGLAAAAGGDSVGGTVVILRLFGLACLLLLAVPLSSLARRAGRRPAEVLGAVLCSPLVLVELVGAAHNEPLMLLLVAAGVAVGLAALAEEQGRHRLVMFGAGVALCGAAAGVKLPGLLGAAVLGWLWAGPGPVLRRVPSLVASVALAAAVVVALSLGSGLGMGWVGALDVPQRAHTLLAPFTSLGVVLEQALSYLGLPSAWVLSVLRPAGFVLGLAAAAFLVTRADRLGAPLALGSALLVLAATGPAVWPWYLVWGLVFVGTVTMPPGLQVAVVGLNLALTPLGPGTLDVTHRPNASALFLVLVTAAGGVGLWWSYRRRSDAGRSDDGAVDVGVRPGRLRPGVATGHLEAE